ncbi:RNA-guided endonuclease InsQ/TnpB family protein [Variovorax ginsengisoli]|uniref:Transposase n=1 Tax=Variovorax ginsengisoli TaxID=363844 RepID=A0ABT8SA52_9BURK|nr:transposase [Variovorax ginsengisoli]MDN8616500.1 transposase [Variovorax ginsengisoli]MDO1535670.1 transposase [Variovorax ginsengisoli]
MSDASTLRAHRFQLRPRPLQEKQLARYAGMMRWVWNRALAEQQGRRERGEKNASYASMCKWLTAWRNAPETSWLAEGPVHPQQQVLKRLDAAFQAFFANVKAGKKPGYPHIKRRGEEPCIRFPDKAQFKLDAANGRIHLPKLGWVRLRMSREVTGELRNASVTREGGRWYVAIQTAQAAVVAAAGLAPTLGVDLGVANFAGLSDGRLIVPLAALKAQQVRLRRYQRSVSRKVKGSCNRKKAIVKLRALHKRIAQQRLDWLHKLTSGLAAEHPVIVIEDLRVAAMTASARGNAQKPGRNVRQKAGLNRAILDAAWSEFGRQLEYKTAAVGGAAVRVNPAYTSRTCRMCEHESAENRKTQSVFACVACGHTEHADIHAAKNILAAGHAAWISGASAGSDACGGVVRRAASTRTKRAAPAKQEPSEGVACA